METRRWEWERRGDVDESAAELDELYDREASNASEHEWYRTETFGLYRERVEVSDERTEDPSTHSVRVRRSLAVPRRIPETYAHYSIGALAVLPLLTAGPAWGLVSLLAGGLLVGPEVDPPLSGLGEPVREGVGPLPSLCIVASLAASGLLLLTFSGSLYGLLCASTVVLGGGVLVLTYQWRPPLALGAAGRVLRHHLEVFSMPVLAVLVLYGANGLVDMGLYGLLLFRGETGGEPDRSAREVVAAVDVAGTPELQLGLFALAVFTLLVGILYLLGTLGEYITVASFLESVRALRNASIPSDGIRLALAGLFACGQLTVLLLGSVALGASAALLGIAPTTGWYRHLFERVTPSPVDTSYSSLAGLEAGSELLFGTLPVLPWRGTAAILSIVVLLPVLVSIAATGAYLVLRTVRLRRRLRSSTPVAMSGLDTAVPVDVRVTDVDECVYAQPVETAFGRRNYLLVSKPAYQQLSEAEFAAVVLHSSVHLAGRGWLLHVVSSILGAGGGGRNLLLTFRDYAVRDRTADDYSMRHGPGPDALDDAIATLCKADRKRPGSAVPSIHPTFLPSPRRLEPAAFEAPPEALGGLLSPRHASRSLFRWYFGSWVHDVLRPTAHTRRERIREHVD